MTEQDFPGGPVRVEISPLTHYARAGARVDRDPDPADPADPARATFLRPRGRATEPGERFTAPDDDRLRYGNGQFAPGPLAGRAERVRDAGHAGIAAARTRLDRAAAALDYLRSAVKAGEKAGFTHTPTESAIDRITADLRAAGDRHTDAMRGWRAAS